MPHSAEPIDEAARRGVDGACHVGVHVRDLEASLRFYRDLLHLEVVRQWVETEEYMRRLVGYPDAVLKSAILRVPGSSLCLEINEYTAPRGIPVDPATANPGTTHIALYVTGLDALLEGLPGTGARIVGEVIRIEGGPLAGGRTVYVADPDGIRVELVESDRLLDGRLRDLA